MIWNIGRGLVLTSDFFRNHLQLITQILKNHLELRKKKSSSCMMYGCMIWLPKVKGEVIDILKKLMIGYIILLDWNNHSSRYYSCSDYSFLK